MGRRRLKNYGVNIYLCVVHWRCNKQVRSKHSLLKAILNLRNVRKPWLKSNNNAIPLNYETLIRVWFNIAGKLLKRYKKYKDHQTEFLQLFCWYDISYALLQLRYLVNETYGWFWNREAENFYCRR